MYEILLIVYLITSIILVGFVLIQQGKGAGMGASFGSGASNTVFGASGSGNFMTRTTGILAVIFFTLSLLLGNLSSNKISADQEFSNLALDQDNANSLYSDIPMDSYETEISEDYFEEEPVPQEVDVAGVLINTKDGTPIKGTILFKSDSGKEISIATDEDGIYKVALPEPGEYEVTSAISNFIPYSEKIKVEMSDLNGFTKLNINLVPIAVGATVRLNKVYFNTGEFSLSTDSYAELNRVVKLMQDHPYLEIEVSGHTDNVGAENANLLLSQNRVNAVKDYVVSKGVSADKITAIGYGQSKPAVANDTEENRQFNRRVQFTILKNTNDSLIIEDSSTVMPE